MSEFNFIKKLLKIKDEHIQITGEPFEETIKRQVCTLIPAKLYNRPSSCVNCGFDSYIVHDWIESRVLLPSVVRYKTFLALKKCRFTCKNCHSTVVSETDLVAKNAFISHAVKQGIAIDLQDKKTIKDIAKDNQVSTSSAYRVFTDLYSTFTPNYEWLPSVLCFDEFDAGNTTDAAMSFICMDGMNGEIVDIVENRRLPFLEKYFLKYSRKARMKVKYIVIDMYSPYMSLAKRLFPKAQLIIDRFHIVKLIGEAMKSTRVEIMNGFKRSSDLEAMKKYRKLKRYWMLLQKSRDKLNTTQYKKYIGFQKLMTSAGVVEEILSYSEELKRHYQIYQEFLWAFQEKDTQEVQRIVEENKGKTNKKFQSVFRSYKKFLSGILNALRLPYSNGKLEAQNNHIKVLKRIAYGYRNFFNFRRRIFIVKGYLKPSIRSLNIAIA